MYYVRKLSKKSTINKVKTVESIEDIPADVLKQEFGTTKNTLSFWKCESLDDNADTIKAILLSTTGIDRSTFIIFSDELVHKYNIIINSDEQGKTGYTGYENLHVNFINLTYKKIGDILLMLREISDSDIYILELSRDTVKQYIMEVTKSNLLNVDHVDEHLMKDMEKYQLL